MGRIRSLQPPRMVLCKSCYDLGKEYLMKGTRWGNSWYLFSCTNPNHIYSLWYFWNGKRLVRSDPKISKSSVSAGDGVEYHDGQRKRFISNKHLRNIRSRVTSHEGETLHGKEGEKYQDRYSKKLLGKDLGGVYKKENVGG